jgi:hypothetical protein
VVWFGLVFGDGEEGRKDDDRWPWWRSKGQVVINFFALSFVPSSPQLLLRRRHRDGELVVGVSCRYANGGEWDEVGRARGKEKGKKKC